MGYFTSSCMLAVGLLYITVITTAFADTIYDVQVGGVSVAVALDVSSGNSVQETILDGTLSPFIAHSRFGLNMSEVEWVYTLDGPLGLVYKLELSTPPAHSTYVYSNSNVSIYCEPFIEESLTDVECSILNSTATSMEPVGTVLISSSEELVISATGDTALVSTALGYMAAYHDESLSSRERLVNTLSNDGDGRDKTLFTFAVLMYTFALLSLAAMIISITFFIHVELVSRVAKPELWSIVTVGVLLVFLLSMYFTIGMFGVAIVTGVLFFGTVCGMFGLMLRRCRSSSAASLTEHGRKLNRKVRKRARIAFVVMLSLVGILGFVLLIYSVPEYYIFDRETGTSVIEYQEEYPLKGTALIYGIPNAGGVTKFQHLLSTLTSACGKKYSKTLSTASARTSSIKDSFIDVYNVDMTLFEPSDYHEYTTVNEWFTRPLKEGVRPIAYPNDSSIVISSSDCRLLVFPVLGVDDRVWLKGNQLTAVELIGTTAYPGLEDGSLVIFRLSPEDYHRFHAPFSGTVVYQEEIPGHYYSVNADAVTSSNEVLVRNTRIVNILENENGTQIAFVAIGATCVGSVIMVPELGDSFQKGDDIGRFEFGGSTVVMIFPPSSIEFDDDLIYNSKRAVETKVEMGQTLGTLLY